MADNSINILRNDYEATASDNTSLVSLLSETVSVDNVNFMIKNVVNGSWDNLAYPFSEWQKSQLEHLPEPGVRCLLSMWFTNQTDLPQGTT